MADQPPEDDVDETYVRPFSDFIREQANGKTHDEVSEALHELVGRVRDTRKKGTVTLTIEVSPMKGDRDAMVIADKVTLKLPEHDRKASVFFADDQGNLTREDPNQPTFESLREVSGVKLGESLREGESISISSLRDGTKEKQA